MRVDFYDAHQVADVRSSFEQSSSAETFYDAENALRYLEHLPLSNAYGNLQAFIEALVARDVGTQKDNSAHQGGGVFMLRPVFIRPVPNQETGHPEGIHLSSIDGASFSVVVNDQDLRVDITQTSLNGRQERAILCPKIAYSCEKQAISMLRSWAEKACSPVNEEAGAQLIENGNAILAVREKCYRRHYVKGLPSMPMPQINE